MNKTIIGSNPWLAAGGIALSLLLAGIGGWRYALGEGYGLVVLGLFLVVAFIYALALLPRCHQLILDDDGLELAYWFNKGRLEWRDIEGIQLVYHHFYPSLGLLLTEEGQRKWPGRVFERSRMEVDATLPLWLKLPPRALESLLSDRWLKAQQ
ncbi:hypothetical protein [Gallaecimonas sp. GXIMD4217]|uniref:hypothetical protein n=1 Tax=Gallaecimonas sp. GXIMD4217 TaxID=3131927 RepID=UPI00311B09E9